MMMPRIVLARAFARGSRGRGTVAGFTIVEILVALAVAMTFLAALYSSFIQVLRATNIAQARLDALRNGRSAAMTFYDEFKSLSVFSSSFLIGLNGIVPYGDGEDNDGDGTIDEPVEAFDGRDNDGDWNPATDDMHARIDSTTVIYERFQYTVQPPYVGLFGVEADDLGDLNVDEDGFFGRDVVLFRIEPDGSDPDILFRTISYRVDTFDFQPNTLLRTSRTEFTAASGRQSIEFTTPLAFGCIGLDFLYWDPNGDPDPSPNRAGRPYWVQTWNSLDAGSFPTPQLPLPASVFMMVTMYSDPAPMTNYVPGRPIDTIRFPLIVNVEEIIGDIRYPRSNI